MADDFMDFVTLDGFAGKVWYHQMIRDKRILRRARELTPELLFSQGEQGVWYDPSDLSTLFKYSDGTIPVTVAGQPVGLMLDKSQGLVLGPELVTNGDFSAGTTGWALQGGWTVSGGTANSNDPTGFSDISQAASFTVGNTYLVSLTVSNYVSGNFAVFLSTSGNAIGGSIMGSSNGVFSGYLKHLDGLNQILVRANGGFIGSVDNISVKLLAGNHASQPTATKRPLLQSTSGKWWLDFDVIDDELIATFPSSLGSACTIGKALNPASTIVGAQTIGTTYTMNADNFSTVITNDALTADETAKLQTWLDKKAGNV